MPDLETSLSYCTYCPKLCRHVCPVSSAEARETVVPQAKMATMGHLRAGTVEKSVDEAAALYACTGCLACTEACHHGITPGLHLMTGRAEAEAAGVGHPSLKDLPARVAAHGRAAIATARASLSDGESTARATAFLPSCDEPGGAKAALALFARLGEDVALARVSVGCGGYPLLAGGFPDAFRAHAETVARELAGASRVVVDCAACAWAMKKEYPARGVTLAPRIVHTVELLAEHAARVTPPSETKAAVYYHDPCYLGRHQGLYDGPRELLRRALGDGAVREFSRSRAEAECSGGGGVLPLTAPATAQAIAEHRVAEVREAGLDTVVTACATCKRQLARDGIKTRGLVEVLEESVKA